MYFFCLNQLNLSKYTTLEHKQHNLSPENCLLEIKASTFEGPLLKFQYSTLCFTRVVMLTYSQRVHYISKLMGFSLMVIVVYPWHSFCCQMAKQNRWQFPGSSGKIVCWYFSIELVGRQLFCKDTSRFQSNTFFKQFGILSIRYLRSKQKEFNRKKNLFPVWG